MAKLAPPKKASKPTAPKKPSTRSKTGNAACSEAASNWQLSLRGKASLNPETYRTLAKCRAMNRTAKMAEAQGRTGKLSAMGEQAVKARLQARFDSGLITQKARTERLDMLLKQRSQRGNQVVAKSATTEVKPASSTSRAMIDQWEKRIDAIGEEKALPRLHAYQGSLVLGRKFNETTEDYFARKGYSDFAQWAKDRTTPYAIAMERGEKYAFKPPKAVLVQRGTDSGGGEMIPPKPAQPARYSLGGKLAPGRGKDSPEYRERLERVTDKAKKYVSSYDRGLFSRPKTAEYADRVKSLRNNTIPALHAAHTAVVNKNAFETDTIRSAVKSLPKQNDSKANLLAGAIPLAMKSIAPKGFESIIIPSSKTDRLVVSAKPIKGNKQVSVQKLSRGGYAALDTESGMLLNVGSVSMKGAERYGRAAEYLLKRAERNTGKKLKFSDFARDKALDGYWKTLMSIQGNRRLK